LIKIEPAFIQLISLLMKILSTSQIRAWDAYTIENEPITAIDLMERASEAFTQVFTALYPQKQPIKILCGLGNNGGDGLAIARLLLQKGYTIEVYIVRYAEKTSPDFALNYQRLSHLITIHEIKHIEQFPDLQADTLWIDALFGSGLSRSLQGLSAEVVQAMNRSSVPIVAVDIASGLFADSHTTGSAVIRPTHTITFQCPKLAFLLPQNARFVGNWQVAAIGLHPQYLENINTDYQYLTPDFLQTILRPRPKFAHKGTFGHALLMAGSFGKMGACILATQACLRSGVGLTTVRIPRCGYDIMQSSVPEAMADCDNSANFLAHLPDWEFASAVGMGCGIDKNPQTRYLLQAVLETITCPLVLDADALNILGENRTLLSLLPPNTILTPHPKEFERLTRPTDNHFERLDILCAFAQVYRVCVILKGANSAIATPDGKVFFNSTGNPGMATAGMGDALTGLLAGLRAQGYSAEATCLLGVYLHGLAGDIFAQTHGQEALTAGELITCIGKAFESIRN
jgi:NAD(P)H-hydrate epimerase